MISDRLYSLLYALYILFLIKDGDTTRNFNINKCLLSMERDPFSEKNQTL